MIAYRAKRWPEVLVFARVAAISAEGASPEKGLAFFRDRVMPDLERLEGFREALLLVAQDSSDALVISLWETEEALRAAERTPAPHRRTEAKAALGADQRRDVRVYEVAHRATSDRSKE